MEHLFIHWHMQGRPKKEKSIMNMLDPFIEIVLDGIRARKEEPHFTLYLKREDARDLAQFITEKGNKQNKKIKETEKFPQIKKTH